MHYFPRMSTRDILWNYSYINIAMLMSSIPTYNPKNEKERKAKDLEIKDISEIGGLF